MKIEDIFRNGLKDLEMPTNASLFNKINEKTKHNNIFKQEANKITSTIKSASLLSKTIISVITTSLIAGAGILLYNNNDNTQNNTTELQENNTNLSNNDNKIENLIADSVQYDKKTQIQNEKIADITFEITEDSVFAMNNYDNTTLPEHINTQKPNPITLKSIIPQDTSKYQTFDDTTRTNSNNQIKIKIPNVLTPNGDGINDCFIIKNIENYSNNKLIIFNRNGKIVYQKDNYNNEFCPQNLTEGTYFYTLKIKNKDLKKDFHGTITIIL